MNSLSVRESLPAVTAAGIVAIASGSLGALGCLISGLVISFMPQLQSGQGAPPMPPEARTMVAVVVFFLSALGVFGILVGIGVIRRRNWARISILVWGGIMAFFCLSAIALSFVAFSAMRSAQLPNVNAAESARIMHFMNVFLAIFYGIPAAIGVWWIVLFTRKRVVMAFTNPLPSFSTVDASGFPQLAPSPAGSPQKGPACPLPIAILAGLMIFGAFFLILLAFLPLTSDMPLFLFGHPFVGPASRLLLIVFGIVSGAAAVGIFKLKPWALYTQIIFQFFGLLNCTIAALSPNYPAVMRAAMERMYFQNPAVEAGSPFMSDSYFRSLMFFSTLMIALVLAVLLWQRPRFLEQAEAAAAKS